MIATVEKISYPSSNASRASIQSSPISKDKSTPRSMYSYPDSMWGSMLNELDFFCIVDA